MFFFRDSQMMPRVGLGGKGEGGGGGGARTGGGNWTNARVTLVAARPLRRRSVTG